MKPACTTLLVCLLVVCAISGAAFGQAEPTRHINGKPYFTVIPRGDSEAALQESLAATNVPMWSSSFTFNSTTYNYTMVGTNPASGSATSKIPVVIIPVKFKFGKVIISPTVNACGDTASALTRVKKSPLLMNFNFVEGTTNIGKTQYIDAFQRSNFWNSVGSVSPNYHVLLSPVTVKAAQTIIVPSTVGGLLGAFCGTQQVGAADINFVDAKLQALITSLSIPATSLPIFLAYDVFETQGGGCCILGYHSATSSNHTYAVAAYSDPGIFSVPIEDIHAMSHELGEWMDDPFGNNIVPAWGNVGQVVGCQNNLEVGDPVTGNAFTVTLNSFTYHPEDLVFFSWFSHETPSIAVNGWYTFLNGFSSPPPACP